MPSPKKVVLVIEAATSYGRGLLSGIAEYARIADNWQIYRDFPETNFYLEPNFYSDPEQYVKSRAKRQRLERFRRWGIDGIITRDPRTIIAQGISCVIAVHIEKGFPGSPVITPDNRKIASLAAEHFLERGFTNFAFCGFKNVYGSRRREYWFKKILNEKGNELIEYFQPDKKHFKFPEDELPYLGNWLKSLPKNTALFSCNDDRVQYIVEACRHEGINIPEDLALLSVDNDELICDLADPPVSSIELDCRKAGYEAARILDLMMNGGKAEKEQIVVDPTYVVTRKSTEILAIKDPDVAGALEFIRNNSRKSISVSDIMDQVPVSRRVLERRFREVLKRSILDEIKRVRMQQVQMLLSDTNLTLSQIANRLDFSSSKHVCRLFKQHNNISPIEYRKKHQLKTK